MNKNKSLLILADWHNAPTGFGTVMKNILPCLQAKFTHITYVAINYFGETHGDSKLKIVSARDFFIPPDGQADPYGKHSFLRLVATTNFTNIFIFQDIGIIDKLLPTLKELKKHKHDKNLQGFHTACYFPVDYSLPKNYLQGWEFFDALVTYNEYSQKQVVKANHKLPLSLNKKRLHIVNHGNNNKDFYELDFLEMQEFKRKYFGDNWRKFIITAVNRNQPRKDIGTTILGYIEAKKLFKTTYPDLQDELFLYLHMMDSDKLMNGYELRQIFSQTDLIEGNDYMISDQTMFTKSGGADVATLNAIYNASDCFLTTTLGGGWELTVTEAMACRCPVIAPYHTSLVEISGHGKRMWNLYELEPFCSPFDSIIRAKCNIDEIAEMILDVYNQQVAATDTLKTKLNAAQKYVLSLDWNILGNRLAEIIYDC